MSEAEIAFYGVVLGATLTKAAEWIQPTNRRLKRASKPVYEPLPDYKFGSHSSFDLGVLESQDLIVCHVKYPSLAKVAKGISLRPKSNCKISSLQLSGHDREVILEIDIDRKKKFSFQLQYEADGFRFSDYWVGNAVAIGRTGYQIDLNGPYSWLKYV